MERQVFDDLVELTEDQMLHRLLLLPVEVVRRIASAALVALLNRRLLDPDEVAPTLRALERLERRLRRERDQPHARG